jgi:hypothetical protein
MRMRRIWMTVALGTSLLAGSALAVPAFADGNTGPGDGTGWRNDPNAPGDHSTWRADDPRNEGSRGYGDQDGSRGYRDQDGSQRSGRNGSRGYGGRDGSRRQWMGNRGSGGRGGCQGGGRNSGWQGGGGYSRGGYGVDNRWGRDGRSYRRDHRRWS